MLASENHHQQQPQPHPTPPNPLVQPHLTPNPIQASNTTTNTTMNGSGHGVNGTSSYSYMMINGGDVPSHVNGDRENGRVNGHHQQHQQQQQHHQQPYPTSGPSHPTTAISRQNSSSSTASSVAPAHESSAELLRQTLSGNILIAPNTRPNSRSSSRRRKARTPQTPRSGVLTPATLHGSPENSENESPSEEIVDHEYEGMRHGFEDEYNSEAYLAVLEQVGFCFTF